VASCLREESVARASDRVEVQQLAAVRPQLKRPKQPSCVCVRVCVCARARTHARVRERVCAYMPTLSLTVPVPAAY